MPELTEAMKEITGFTVVFLIAGAVIDEADRAMYETKRDRKMGGL